MIFETVVADFPDGHAPSSEVLRHIFFSNLRNELKTALLGVVAPEDTWKTLAAAAATRESALFLGNDHLLNSELAFPRPTEPAFQLPPPAADPSTTESFEPTPMEIDALSHRRNYQRNGYQAQNNRNYQSRSKPPSSNRDRRQEDPMRRWARPGVPICGHCGTEGHLTKRCFKKPPKHGVHALEQTPTESAPANEYPSDEPSTDDIICSLTYMTKPSVSYRGPRPQCKLKDATVEALVDTGASISAIDSRLAADLGLVPDSDRSVSFTTADNRNTASLGTVSVRAILGELPVDLRCHVIENLSYPVIIGYSDLTALKAIIDTC
ncbi:hypothetical protein G6F58_012257 [Rhizopus delemar]|nr:hypothetical protein G6F58_012257 [Rhizopus delemar]